MQWAITAGNRYDANSLVQDDAVEKRDLRFKRGRKVRRLPGFTEEKFQSRPQSDDSIRARAYRAQAGLTPVAAASFPRLWSFGSSARRRASTAACDAEALRYLGYLGPDPANWVPTRGGIDYDVVIVGGGQFGVSMAHALRRASISNVLVIDAEREGGQGVWCDKARMRTLRTQKTAFGPEQNNPVLSFLAWFAARNGAEAFQQMGRIPRLIWADYLDWLRGILKVEVSYETRLVNVAPDGEGLRLILEYAGKTRELTARKLILATGLAHLSFSHLSRHGEFSPPVGYRTLDGGFAFSGPRHQRAGGFHQARNRV